MVDLPQQNAIWGYVAAGDIIDELCHELRVQGEDLAVVKLPAARDATHLVAEVQQNPKGVAVVDVSALAESDWRALDVQRSRLTRHGVTIWILTQEDLDRIQQCAPNLSSWLGGNVAEHRDDTAEAEAFREGRLEALRAWSGKTDDEVCREAAARTLPRDPEYAEWLVLLGRGDLLDA